MRQLFDEEKLYDQDKHSKVYQGQSTIFSMFGFDKGKIDKDQYYDENMTKMKEPITCYPNKSMG